MTTGVEGVFHGLPYGRIDPFVSLGMGWRGMWERNDGPANDVFRHGLSVARLGIGVDIRVSRDIALAPVVAADANIFLWQDRADVTGSRTIGDPRLNFFLSAGLQGRFDLGGERVDRSGKAVSTTTTTGAVEPGGGLLKPTGTLHSKGGEVHVTEEIASACEIHFDNDATAPKFDFDESEVLPQDRDVLAQVAACVTTGPLKGRALKLVGRADPRGEVEYNMALGERRAESVQSYLSHLGVESGRMLTTSRGELDATGTDEASWQHDRRVDILLQ
jgi:peptidoglycan-associated lipoprotein